MKPNLKIAFADNDKRGWAMLNLNLERTDGPAPVGAAIVLVVAVLLAAAMFAVHIVPWWIGWRGL